MAQSTSWLERNPTLATILGMLGILAVVGFLIWLFTREDKKTSNSNNTGNSGTGGAGASSDTTNSGQRSSGSTQRTAPWAGCSDISYGNSLDYISARNNTTVYNPDYTIYVQALVNDPIGALVRKECEWYVVGTAAGEKYILVSDSKFDSGLPRNASNIPLLYNDEIRFTPYRESEVIVFTHPRNSNLKIAVLKTDVDKYRVYSKGDPTKACACYVDSIPGDEFTFMDTTICIPGCAGAEGQRFRRYNGHHGPRTMGGSGERRFSVDFDAPVIG